MDLVRLVFQELAETNESLPAEEGYLAGIVSELVLPHESFLVQIIDHYLVSRGQNSHDALFSWAGANLLNSNFFSSLPVLVHDALALDVLLHIPTSDYGVVHQQEAEVSLAPRLKDGPYLRGQEPLLVLVSDILPVTSPERHVPVGPYRD